MSSRLFAMLASAAAFAASAPVAASSLHAQRTRGPIHLDGKPEEAAWSSAPVFSDFVESFPNQGIHASPKTEVRVLHDDELLYFGVKCFDPEPERIVRLLGRRDSAPASDLIEIAIATSLGDRTAYDFSINAAGVLRDQLLYADVNAAESWDAIWDGAVHLDADGWTAEVAIPFRVMRFTSREPHSWRVLVRRVVPRTHQVFDSTLIPRDANPVKEGAPVVSRFGPLEGMDEVRPSKGLELLPYAGARAILRPQYSDPSRAEPRLLEPSLDLGLDFRLPLGSDLMLTGAINPDFGQVESDRVVQNVSTSEAFFPEKRPFFLEALDLFQPVGAEYFSHQQLFYSRRIGLTAPILGAVKLSGSATPRLDVGILEAVVSGAGNGALGPLGNADPSPDELARYEANPDRTWRFHLQQPLHFGPQSALPNAPPVTTNYFAAVARQRVSNTAVGAAFTSMLPLEPRCRPEEFASRAEFEKALCASLGGQALGLDLLTQDAQGEYGGFAQLSASQQVGGPAEGRILPDGTRIQAGDLGFGGHLRAGKLGGQPFRWDVVYAYEDAKLDLNRMGFQPLSNYQWTDLDLQYVRPNGWGPFRSAILSYNLDLNWSADGKWLPRGINQLVQASVQLPSFDTVGVKAGLEIPQYDTREIDQSGIAFERASDLFAALFYATDSSRRLFASGDLYGMQVFGKGPFPHAYGGGLDLTATYRPANRYELRVEGAYGLKPQGPRWVDTVDQTGIFGNQFAEFFSATLRQQLVLTPRLTVQLYAQLFSGSVRYDPNFYAASLADTDRVPIAALSLTDAALDANAHESVLNLNALLRWEYRLGSTLYLVYARSQSEPPPPEGTPTATSAAPSRLTAGRVTESVLLKWSYWWGT